MFYYSIFKTKPKYRLNNFPELQKRKEKSVYIFLSFQSLAWALSVSTHPQQEMQETLVDSWVKDPLRGNSNPACIRFQEQRTEEPRHSPGVQTSDINQSKSTQTELSSVPSKSVTNRPDTGPCSPAFQPQFSPRITIPGLLLFQTQLAWSAAWFMVPILLWLISGLLIMVSSNSFWAS